MEPPGTSWLQPYLDALVKLKEFIREHRRPAELDDPDRQPRK